MSAPEDPAEGGRGPVGHIIRDTVGYLPAAVLPGIFSLASSAIFTRIFPPSEYGVYTLLGAVTGPVLSLTAQPAAQAVQRYLAEYEHRGLLEEYRHAVSWLATVTLALVLVLSSAALLVWPLIHGSSVSEMALAGAMAGLWASILYNILTPALMAGIQVRAFRAATIWSRGLSLVIPLLLLAFFGHHIAWILWGNAAAVVITLPYLLRRANVLRWPGHLSELARDTLKRFWAYGAPMTFWFFSSSILSVGDRWVIDIYHGTAQVGLYGASRRLATQGVALLLSPVLNATGPRLLRQWAAGERDGVRRTMARMTNVFLMVGVGLIGLMAASGRALVDILLAHAFRPGAAVLVPIIAGVVVWDVSRIGHKSMEFVEKNSLMVWDVLVAAGINMGLNILLVPRYGFVAAGYATLISYIVYTALVWYQARSLVPWDIAWADLGAYLGAAAIAWGVTDVLILQHHWSRFVVLFLSGAVFLIVYGAVTALYLRRRLQDLLGSLMPRR